MESDTDNPNFFMARCMECYDLEIADKFESRWQYQSAIGAIDGKYVAIRKPTHGGSHYYNYKHSHSLIVMKLVNIT